LLLFIPVHRNIAMKQLMSKNNGNHEIRFIFTSTKPVGTSG
jgi:hypothetical protein